MAGRFNKPDQTHAEVAPRFFIVSMREWGALVRRMVQSRLAVDPPEWVRPDFSGGSFSVEIVSPVTDVLGTLKKTSVRRAFMPFFLSSFAPSCVGTIARSQHAHH